MPARRSNLWPFTRTAPAAKTARQTSHVQPGHMQAAYRAGKASGDRSRFDAWLRSQDLENSGRANVNRLKAEYTKGVWESYTKPERAGQRRPAPAAAERPTDEQRLKYKIVAYKGVTIIPTGDGFKTSLDTSEFDTVTDAKRFIDSWQKNPKRNGPLSESVQEKSHREWAENFARVSAHPEKATEKDLRRAIGYLDHARSSTIRKAQESGRTLDANVLAGFDNEHEYYVSLIKKHEAQRPKRNVTDRAHRYRANSTPPDGPKVCNFCGSKQNVEVGHVDGHEEHGESDNLIWTCRSCNVIAANTMRNAGIGRLTKQYNPTKSGGAATVGEWMRAVGSIVPHKGARYAGDNYGLVAAMPVHEAVAMIRATPAAKRREYASKLRRHKNGNDLKHAGRQGLEVYDQVFAATAGLPRAIAGKVLNPSIDAHMWQELHGEARTARSAEELRRLYKWASDRREPEARELLVIVETRAKQERIPMSEVRQQHPSTSMWARNPSYSLVQAAAGAGEHSGREWPTGKQPSATAMDREFKDWLEYRRNSMPEIQSLSADDRKQLRIVFFRGVRQGFSGTRRNPEDSAEALYESFHGRPSEEIVEIREEVHEHENLAALGMLREIVVDTESGFRATIRFDKEPFLACSEDGRQLYIEGGDQELDLAALKMDGEKWTRDRMVIGRFAPPEQGATETNGKRYWNLMYRTQKKFDDFQEIDYCHDLGEETGVRPYLEYDSRNQKLHIAGGQYFIKQPLIGVSPGIEN